MKDLEPPSTTSSLSPKLVRNDGLRKQRCTVPRGPQIADSAIRRCGAFVHSPLGSPKSPLPGTSAGTRWQPTTTVFAYFTRVRAVALASHRVRPLGSINAPSLVSGYGYTCRPVFGSSEQPATLRAPQRDAECDPGGFEHDNTSVESAAQPKRAALTTFSRPRRATATDPPRVPSRSHVRSLCRRSHRSGP